MWEQYKQYKKTFRGMQIAIGLVVGAVLIVTRTWTVAAVFFATMQVGAVLGAMWGTRLKRILGGAGARGDFRGVR
jgi:hypothetical protein